jgi:hypothetical protein
LPAFSASLAFHSALLCTSITLPPPILCWMLVTWVW